MTKPRLKLTPKISKRRIQKTKSSTKSPKTMTSARTKRTTWPMTIMPSAISQTAPKTTKKAVAMEAAMKMGIDRSDDPFALPFDAISRILLEIPRQRNAPNEKSFPHVEDQLI